MMKVTRLPVMGAISEAVISPLPAALRQRASFSSKTFVKK
jgi:hypothetical protein